MVLHAKNSHICHYERIYEILIMFMTYAGFFFHILSFRGLVFFITVDVLPVADVLQVASRILPAQFRLLVERLQPGVGISAELGAGRHAARGRAPHLSSLSTRLEIRGVGAPCTVLFFLA